MKSKHAGLIFFAIASAWFSAPLAFAGGSTLVVISSWPPHVSDADEDPTKRAARLTEIADAIDGATGDRQERAALITQAKHESHLADYVFRNDCKSGPRGAYECDGTPGKGHRAHGIYQLHGDVPDDLAGQTAMALRLWKSHLKRCRGSVKDEIAGAFSGMATGGKCGWGGAAKRAATMRGLVSRL